MAGIDLCMSSKDMSPAGKKVAVSKYPKDGTFMRELLTHLMSSNHPSMLKSQFAYTTHPLCIHALAWTFARLDKPDKSYQEFKKFVTAAYMNADLKQIEVDTVEQSKSGLWKSLHYCRTTASIFNETASCVAEGAIERTILKHFGALPFQTTDAMDRGLRLEDPVRRLFAKDMKRKIRAAGMRFDPSFPLFGASPDGNGTDFIIEMKSPSREENKWNYRKKSVPEPTKQVLLQMLLQMRLCHVNQGYLIIVDPKFEINGKYESLHVKFSDHEKLFEDSVIAVEKFWEKYLFPTLMKTVV